ncbi:hypothetical protein C2E23DRAFT_698659, partial [Lenzites betulinus]
PALKVPDLPRTRGLTEKEVNDLLHHPDAELEKSGQPLSAWYLRWKTPLSMSEAYAALDADESEDEGDADPEDFDLQCEADCPFPDPVLFRRGDLSKMAEVNEGYRVSKVQGKNKGAIASTMAIQRFAEETASTGPWAGTTISSVVQAHNLRWWVAVEFDARATAYWKALRSLYSRGELRRSSGVRYLLEVAPSDDRTLVRRRRDDLPRFFPVLSPNRFPYPPIDASDADILSYHRNVPTAYWSTGVRLASGALPARSHHTFGIPDINDARASGCIKRTLAVPKPGRVGAFKERILQLRIALTHLFSVPGLYRHLCDRGGYLQVPLQPAAPFPFLEYDGTRLAAWLAEFGVGQDEVVISYAERWGRVLRNR